MGHVPRACYTGSPSRGSESDGTNLVILLAAGVTTFVTVDKAINGADLPATILLMALGLFGAIFSAQHYER